MRTHLTTALRAGLRLLCFVAASLALPAAAQAPSTNAQVAGKLDGIIPDPNGREVHASFKCTGYPTCIGTAHVRGRDLNCSNFLDYTTEVDVTNLDLSRPGSFTATMRLLNANEFHNLNADGTCTFLYFSGDVVQPLNVTFDGVSSGTLQLDTTPVSGPFKVTSPPVFPMIVTATVTNTATASATFQYRPQDVGTTGNVYVFAMAPPAIVKAAADGTKADAALPCVLAQLSASGQLVAVSAQSLQAYASGVLTAGNQAVTLLNGVPTANIAGATFYLGYGTSGSSMYASGVNRAALSIAGSTACKSEMPQTGWWWNPAEGGRGFSIEAHDNVIFLASYLYDATGQASWLAAGGTTTLEGAAFQGDLQAYANGQVLGGSYRAAQGRPSPGAVTLTFQDATHGVLSWPGGNIPIQRYDMVPGGTSLAPLAGQPQSGWWWNDQEGGRGYFIEWQGANAFLASYMYAADGTPIWYASQAATPDVSRFNGTLAGYSGGQTLTGAYKPPGATSSIGPVTLTFTGADTAQLTLPKSGPVAIKRFRF